MSFYQSIPLESKREKKYDIRELSLKTRKEIAEEGFMARKKRYKRTQEGKTSRLVCDIMVLINEVGETKLKDLFKIYISEKYNYIYSKVPSKRQLLLLLKLAEVFTLPMRH